MKRNPIAKALQQKQFKQKKIPSGKDYSRKEDYIVDDYLNAHGCPLQEEADCNYPYCECVFY